LPEGVAGARWLDGCTCFSLMAQKAPPLPLFMPLETARVCLDCDLLADSLVCPLCARARTVPIAWWLRPLDGAPLPTALVTYRAASGPGASPRPARADSAAARAVIVVQGAHAELYERLRRSLPTDAPFDLIYERRRRDRRRAEGIPGVERRRANRRQRAPAAMIYDRSVVGPDRAGDSQGSSTTRRAADVLPSAAWLTSTPTPAAGTSPRHRERSGSRQPSR
jgi:hypothetical protein